MAVAQVGSAINSTAVNAQTNTLQVTVNAGESLFVAIGFYQGSGQSITSVVWDPPGVNQAMTQIGIQVYGNADGFAALYCLANPTAKTANVVATFVNANTYSVMSITKWTGVDTSTPYHGNGTAVGEGATSTINVASVVSGEVTIDSHFLRRGNEDQPGAGQVSQVALSVLGSTDQYVAASSVDTSGTGTVTMSWAQTGSAHWAVVACAIQAAAAAGGTNIPKIMNYLNRMKAA